MATTSRDAKLVLSVEALGQENISKLEKQLRDLAATGDASAAEFGELADQIGRLGSQSDALQAVKALADDTDVLRARQEAAALAAQTLASKLDTLKTATNETKVGQEGARAALVAGEQAYVQTGNALRALKTEYDAAGRNTDEYRSRLKALVAEQNDSRLALVGLREASRQATAAVTEANAEQRKVESTYKAANAEYTRATTALDEQAKALRVASGAAEQLGVNVEDLVAAEATLVSTFTNASSAAKARAKAISDMADADRLAAIEAKGLADLYARGASALQSETLALRDAERATIAYTAAKTKATADAAAWQREADAIVSMKEAEQQATKASGDLVRQLTELRNIEAFEKQASAAQKMVQSAEYVRFWEQALDAADRKQSELAAGTQRLNAAFAQINVRPVEAVKQEIAATNAAMQTLAASGRLTGGALATAMAQGQAKVSALEREMRQLTGTLTLADKAAALLKNSMGQIAAGNIIADGVGYLVNKVKEMGREFIQANLEMERLTRTMTQITGSAKGAADQIAFLREVSNKAGVSVSAITDSFIRFQAAASASGTSAQEVNSIFQAVTVSGSKMGMSADRVALALDALGQMASKGTVSMEELRQQLGDSLPGATAIAAKGLGLTTGELTKLVESGQLSTEQFFPAFRRGLEETFGSADKNVTGLVQAFARLGNKFTELYQQAADSTAFKLLAQSADVLTRNFDSLVSVIGGLGKALLALKLLDYIGNIGRMGEASKQAAAGISAQVAATQSSTAAVAGNTVATAANTASKAANNAAVAAQGTAAAGARAAVAGLTTAQAAGTAAAAANTSATSANTAAKTANTLATRAQAAANAAMTIASTATVGAVRAAGTATTAAVGGVRALAAAMGGLPGLFVLVAMNARELGTWLGETVAKWGAAGAAMRKYEAEMAAQAAREKQIAADREAAQAKALQAIQKEVAGLQERRKVLLAEEATTQKATEAQAKRADLIERTAALYGDETKALQASEQATRINLAAAEAELGARNKVVLALQEEIAKREKLLAGAGVRNEKAAEELQKLRDLLGVKTQEEEKLRSTTELLRLESAERKIATEAYKDNSEKIVEYKQAMEDARKTLADVQAMEKAGLPVKEALAKAEQNLGVQTRLYNDAVKDKLAKLQAESALEQANLNIKTAGLQVRQQELLSQAASAKESGNYTAAINLEIEAKKVQIEITRLNAEAKRLEAESTIKAATAELEQLRTTGSLTDAKRLEIEARIANAKAKQTEAEGGEIAVRNLEREIEALRKGTAARRDSVSALDAEAAARERVIAAQEKELDLKTRELKLQEAKRNAGTIQNVDGVPSFENQEQADAWLSEWKAQYQRDNPFSTRSGGQLGNFMHDMTMFEYQKELDAMALRNAMKVSGNATTSVQTPLDSMRSGAGKTVTVNIRGRSTPINTSSDADANNLVSLLRQLETESQRST